MWDRTRAPASRRFDDREPHQNGPLILRRATTRNATSHNYSHVVIGELSTIRGWRRSCYLPGMKLRRAATTRRVSPDGGARSDTVSADMARDTRWEPDDADDESPRRPSARPPAFTTNDATRRPLKKSIDSRARPSFSWSTTNPRIAISIASTSRSPAFASSKL